MLVKYVQDPLADTLESEEGWKALSSENDIQFDPTIFYEKNDGETAAAVLAELEGKLAEQKQGSKDKKKAEKTAREARQQQKAQTAHKEA